MARSAARVGLILWGLTVLCGCASSPHITRAEEFAPNKLRIHPTFTQVKDWTGDGHPDGIEVVVELLDAFDEPTRGNGTLVFELYAYRKYDPDIQGNRLGGPWKGTLLTREEQTGHWSQALRAYTFQLENQRTGENREYVLTASFESANGASASGGGRLFDRLIIEPPPGSKSDDDRGVGRARGLRR